MPSIDIVEYDRYKFINGGKLKLRTTEVEFDFRSRYSIDDDPSMMMDNDYSSYFYYGGKQNLRIDFRNDGSAQGKKYFERVWCLPDNHVSFLAMGSVSILLSIPCDANIESKSVNLLLSVAKEETVIEYRKR